jgi:enamine deaminase RidA (YjgF/YER057c/UK114 family)
MNERAGTVADRLARLGLQIPPAEPPVAAFEPYVRHGSTIYVSGQIATRDGHLVAAGRLGAEVDLAAGQDAARACAVNVLAQLQAAAGSLDAVTRLVKLTVYRKHQRVHAAAAGRRRRLAAAARRPGRGRGPCPFRHRSRRTAPGLSGRGGGHRTGRIVTTSLD